ncbi:MAG: hypothetical protein V7K92_25645, partial [Nostoc sp.]
TQFDCYFTISNFGMFQFLNDSYRHYATPVYQFVPVDDEGDSIFGQWLNRDEASYSELVSVSNNISTTSPVVDTTPQLIREDSDLVSVSNNISTTTPVIDTQSQDIPQTLTPVESPATHGWKGLKLKIRQGLDSVGSFYSELISKEGEAIGVADGEPYTEGISRQVAGLG